MSGGGGARRQSCPEVHKTNFIITSLWLRGPLLCMVYEGRGSEEISWEASFMGVNETQTTAGGGEGC